MFEYTRSEFWGGPSIPYWILAVFTVMFGFIGLDHILLRSPTTALVKFIFNIFTLGLWYFYDVIQVIGDKDKVMNYGLTAPLYGPLGIGAGMFTDNQPDAPKSTAPWRFLLYSMLVFVPFGLDSFIGGDSSGGVIKFICTIIPIFWPILFFWMVLSIGRLYIFPKPLFTEGIDRPFPVSFFMDKKGTSVLGPKPVPDPTSIGCDSYDGGFLGYLPPFVRTALTFVFPGLIPAIHAGLGAAEVASNTVSAGFKTAKVAAETAGKALEGTKKVIEAATSVAAGAASGLPALVATGTGAASAVTGSLQKYKDPTQLQQLTGMQYDPMKVNPYYFPSTEPPREYSWANRMQDAQYSYRPSQPQLGGGEMIVDVDNNSTLSNAALIAGFAIILGGGVYYGLKRLNKSTMSLFRREPDGNTGNQKGGEKGRKRDDSPPQPS